MKRLGRHIGGALVGCAVALAAAAPAGAQGGGTIVADEFDGTSLNTSVWSLANPLDDASVAVSGGTAKVALPSGPTHDVWGNVNTVSGLRQAVPDRDFEIEAKFTTKVVSGFQMEGLIVEQDSNDLVRAEVHHDGSGARLFVATMFNGTPEVRHWESVPNFAPVYVRVVRTGNVWRVRHSNDGQTWTSTSSFSLPITVTRAGPLVGNSAGQGGGSPAFTASIDSFREVLPDSTPPVITGVGATSRTLDATVHWTTDEPAGSHVAYGPTSGYGSTKIGSDGLVKDHSVELHGLACGKTYHFQVKSADAAGNTRTAPDAVFTTAACPTAMQSDEFNGASVDMSRWTLVDPGGGASVAGNGSHALIDLPAGVQHDLWTGSDTMARLLQPAPDEDFELRVKYDSVLAATYQMQGFLVSQDGNDLLRLEVHYEGGVNRLFAASIENGVASMPHEPVAVPDGAPVYLRLRRAGSTWTFSYSQNGVDWIRTITFTRAMTVTAAGLLAGNSGGAPPAFLARADWFRYTAPDQAAPVVSEVAAAARAGSTARVTWTTDEPSGSEVSFGTTTAYTGGTIAAPGDVRDHAVVLHGLTCATTYHYRVRSTDAAGNAASGTDRTFTSSPCPAALTSDEFNAAALDTGTWAFIDPLGDSAMSVGSGVAQLSVPAGTAHDLWADVRTVPRLLQAAPDTNFNVLVKFDTGVAATTQQQGIVVEQSHDKLLRFEAYSEGGLTHLFVAAIDRGSAEILRHEVVRAGSPVYMRLNRVNDFFTMGYSIGGTAWYSVSYHRPFDVTAIGPYVGNGGYSPPAFQSRIDYFRANHGNTQPPI